MKAKKPIKDHWLPTKPTVSASRRNERLAVIALHVGILLLSLPFLLLTVARYPVYSVENTEPAIAKITKVTRETTGFAVGDWRMGTDRVVISLYDEDGFWFETQLLDDMGGIGRLQSTVLDKQVALRTDKNDPSHIIGLTCAGETMLDYDDINAVRTRKLTVVTVVYILLVLVAEGLAVLLYIPAIRASRRRKAKKAEQARRRAERHKH